MNKRHCPEAARDDQLRAEFQAATARERRSAADVLRDLMWHYVELQRVPKQLPGLLERLTVVRSVTPAPVEAAHALSREHRELEELVARQQGWRDDAYRHWNDG